jgi:hypothetical protein
LQREIANDIFVLYGSVGTAHAEPGSEPSLGRQLPPPCILLLLLLIPFPFPSTAQAAISAEKIERDVLITVAVYTAI